MRPLLCRDIYTFKCAFKYAFKGIRSRIRTGYLRYVLLLKPKKNWAICIFYHYLTWLTQAEQRHRVFATSLFIWCCFVFVFCLLTADCMSPMLFEFFGFLHFKGHQSFVLFILCEQKHLTCKLEIDFSLACLYKIYYSIYTYSSLILILPWYSCNGFFYFPDFLIYLAFMHEYSWIFAAKITHWKTGISLICMKTFLIYQPTRKYWSMLNFPKICYHNVYNFPHKALKKV